jgi:hypothetical protein
VTLNGVLIRSNKGKGLWAPSLLSDHLLVSGCQLFDNGQVGRLKKETTADLGSPRFSIRHLSHGFISHVEHQSSGQKLHHRQQHLHRKCDGK